MQKFGGFSLLVQPNPKIRVSSPRCTGLDVENGFLSGSYPDTHITRDFRRNSCTREPSPERLRPDHVRYNPLPWGTTSPDTLAPPCPRWEPGRVGMTSRPLTECLLPCRIYGSRHDRVRSPLLHPGLMSTDSLTTLPTRPCHGFLL